MVPMVRGAHRLLEIYYTRLEHNILFFFFLEEEEVFPIYIDINSFLSLLFQRKLLRLSSFLV